MRENPAIPTIYREIEYRSRTEARWAIFFTELGITHHYEPELISLSSGNKYLPDFRLDDFDAWFEVKPNNEAIVTEECAKARLLSMDRPDSKVWLAIGAPNEEEANILPLNQWDNDVSIEQILAMPENRYRVLEDRRDDRVYWLHSEFVEDQFAHSYMIGGPGQSTDHDRLPILMGTVLAAYRAAREYTF